ncbi:hypothetical protein ASPZODRAFT_145209 [Penicilliopsis zonata CBS 506.65]|uniref:Fringe-like glycosyltransferase domain-containing protein n=1 Tax=Penicilliopsis zonata CBS 506.65 TaxID=1073090 RepID=A0A1L9SAC5_9EURO|nr:hypothetical protein ASPZODRAFT_145209 [Penicilliopsis zonata CBS 506.65]OJJ44091.1 hypothetical protein ASPZODRAFT_145209 [Penicilliopsis zonata CBS 506.65]
MLKTRDGLAWSGTALGKKAVRLLVASILIVGFTVFLWPDTFLGGTQIQLAPNITVSTSIACDVDVARLARLGVHKLSKFTQREVVALPSRAKLPITQKLDFPLWETSWMKRSDQGQDQDQDEVDYSPNGCLNPNPIALEFPEPPKRADASHIDFGVATTVKRLNDSLDAFSHWAGYTNTRIFALLEPGQYIPEVQARADAMGIDLYISESSEEYNKRYFSLIPLLHKNQRPETRWACIIDDDTFFPSMSALVDALAGYNDTAPIYLGGVSESIRQIATFGMMAYGGAGVFLSRPLLEALNTAYPECQFMDTTGDKKISKCIYQNTAVRLTIDHRLRQLDMMGDVSGFFEAGRPLPLSLHHWKSWFHADMAKLSVVADICGDSCLLHQWQFTDGWILTNGFSIIHRGTDLAPNDHSIEDTWDSDQDDASQEAFLHELGPLRGKDTSKVSYLLQDAFLDHHDGSVHQWYIRRDPSRGAEILELIWRP